VKTSARFPPVPQKNSFRKTRQLKNFAQFSAHGK
jgi:hypothetical protein